MSLAENVEGRYWTGDGYCDFYGGRVLYVASGKEFLIASGKGCIYDRKGGIYDREGRNSICVERWIMINN